MAEVTNYFSIKLWYRLLRQIWCSIKICTNQVFRGLKDASPLLPNYNVSFKLSKFNSGVGYSSLAGYFQDFFFYFEFLSWAVSQITVYFNAVHLLCEALISKRVTSSQIAHCCFPLSRSDVMFFNHHLIFFLYYFFYFFMVDCKQTMVRQHFIT